MSRVIGRKVEKLNVGDAAGFNAAEPEDPEREGYLDKLVKYVPAEVTAVSAAFFAAFDVTGGGVWLVLAILAVANLLYLAVNAVKTTTQPKWYFYLLATIAFGAWAISTVDIVAKKFGVAEDGQRAFVLMAAAFAIPLIHTGLEELAKRKK